MVSCIKQAINQSIKQEDRFHSWPHMVGLAKARPNKDIVLLYYIIALQYTHQLHIIDKLQKWC